MKFRRTSLAMAVSLSLTACGGGGGGGGTSATLSPYLRTEVPFATPKLAATVDPLAGISSNHHARVTTYTENFSAAGDDLLMFGHQEPGGGNHNCGGCADNNMHMFSWRNGHLIDTTSQWFAGGINVTQGVVAATSGVISATGRRDLIIVPGTDTGTVDHVFLYRNQGSSFNRTRIQLPGEVWGHDATVADLDRDGHNDVIVTSFNANTTFLFNDGAGALIPYRQATPILHNASSIAAADFMGNNTTTVIATDPGGPGHAAQLFSWSLTGAQFDLQNLGSLPTPRFLLPKWSSYNFGDGAGASHEVRVMARDWSGDGLADAVIISRPWMTGGIWPEYSEVQFLVNRGGGNFEDVTDSVLVGYHTGTAASYAPKWLDINGDGLEDLLLSGGNFTANDSSQFLLRSSDGKFVAAHRRLLTDFVTQVNDLAGTTTAGNTVNVLSAPDGKMYLVSAIQHDNNNDRHVSVYISDLGNPGVTTAQTAVNLVRQVWPYMTDPQANDALARTSPSYLGARLIDLDQLFAPVGMLGVSMTGRLGARLPLRGGISVPGMDAALLSNVSAVDDLGRHWQVDMSNSAGSGGNLLIGLELDRGPHQDLATRLVSGEQRRTTGMTMTGHNDSQFASSVDSRYLGWQSPWTVGIGLARMAGSPWMGLSGAFGRIRSSTMIDFSVSRRWTDGWFANGGVVQTVTEFTPGMVREISPLWAGYLTAGYRIDDWTMYGGLQPTLFSGSLVLNVPTSVDNSGVMHYTDTKIDVRNHLISFAGAERRWTHKNQTWQLGGVINDQSDYQVKLTYGLKF